MSYEIRDLDKKDWPCGLLEIPDAPKSLRIVGKLPEKEHIFLSVVGSRKYSNYGREVCEYLVSGLKGYPVSIVSGLALGIDGIAHKSALNVGLHTIAIPGSGLSKNVIYPRSNFGLAMEIVESGGALISEFEDNFKPTIWSFPKRNRIMAGISKAVLLIEAEEKSGTLITSRLATEYNRDIFVVPGNVFSENSKGPHMLLSLGATPVTNTESLLQALGFESDTKKEKVSLDNLNPDEIAVFKLLSEPLSKDNLIKGLGLPTHKVNIAISMLELKGLIKESAGKIFRT